MLPAVRSASSQRAMRAVTTGSQTGSHAPAGRFYFSYFLSRSPGSGDRECRHDSH